jgi:hypothetical protein
MEAVRSSQSFSPLDHERIQLVQADDWDQFWDSRTDVAAGAQPRHNPFGVRLFDRSLVHRFDQFAIGLE